MKRKNDVTIITTKPFHTLSINPEKRKRMGTIDDVPDTLLVTWSLRLFALMNLTWDYVDTILDLCVQMRISDTKPLCRTIRNLKREYDKFRWRNMLKERTEEETDTGLLFEEMFTNDFKLLFLNLDTDVKKLDLTNNHKNLVIATQQALTLIDAVKIYAKRCDKSMADMGVWTCDYCMVQTEFLKMAKLIPQFAGDCYQPDLQIRKQTAQILANRLDKLPIPKKYLTNN